MTGSYYIPVEKHICYGLQASFIHPNLTLYKKHDFAVTCSPSTSSIGPSSLYKFVEGNRCWKTMNAISSVTLALGLVGIVFNASVIVTTLRCRRLRRNVALSLMCNIAFADLLTDLYLVVITSTRRAQTFIAYSRLISTPFFCELISIPMITGLFASLLLSFLLTAERYCKIVHSFNFNLQFKIGRWTKWFTLGVWSFTFICAILISTVKHITGWFDSMCAPLRGIHGFDVRLVILVIAILVYVTCASLYFKIYKTIKHSTQNVGIQIEGKLARKFVFLITSNFLFLVMPVGISWLIVEVPSGVGADTKQTIWKTLSYISLSLNAVLNPLLVAFRHRLFVREFKRQWRCVIVVAPLAL
ncbi:probable glycoprotein hormone G-protein coupled receptor [Nematostella vectensis]|uniref:probable glycoprotein hormone G-protein coupled receptor n=1 Tax=Nematostella vectensis TaxID=45351 RepID=UPI0020772135|nr:probable glycoprotein hormone G-protein coupled receptor [Nematostella vectensis]